MENLLWLISKIIVYIDDILVANISDKQHIELLRSVFAKVQESGLKLKQAKCHWWNTLGIAYPRRESAQHKRRYEQCPKHQLL